MSVALVGRPWSLGNVRRTNPAACQRPLRAPLRRRQSFGAPRQRGPGTPIISGIRSLSIKLEAADLASAAGVHGGYRGPKCVLERLDFCEHVERIGRKRFRARYRMDIPAFKKLLAKILPDITSAAGNRGGEATVYNTIDAVIDAIHLRCRDDVCTYAGPYDEAFYARMDEMAEGFTNAPNNKGGRFRGVVGCIDG
ncbi:hypothetical protein T484DRAFT_1756688 [Baffinella frigidus]|nr:hypothetical protein T484DRAFT_1756688 [Cryptophyta sp. CCMP2293]